MEIKRRNKETSGISLKHCPHTLTMGSKADLVEFSSALNK